MSEDKDAVRQIALFKAISEGDQEMQANIRQGRVLEDEIDAYLSQGYDVDDLHQFRKDRKSSFIDSLDGESMSESD